MLLYYFIILNSLKKVIKTLYTHIKANLTILKDNLKTSKKILTLSLNEVSNLKINFLVN